MVAIIRKEAFSYEDVINRVLGINKEIK